MTNGKYLVTIVSSKNKRVGMAYPRVCDLIQSYLTILLVLVPEPAWAARAVLVPAEPVPVLPLP